MAVMSSHRIIFIQKYDIRRYRYITTIQNSGVTYHCRLFGYNDNVDFSTTSRNLRPLRSLFLCQRQF